MMGYKSNEDSCGCLLILFNISLFSFKKKKNQNKNASSIANATIMWFITFNYPVILHVANE